MWLWVIPRNVVRTLGVRALRAVHRPYEFTLTFARIDHEIEEGDVPGVVVSRVNMSSQFFQELLAAMQDSFSKWSTQEGIRNLPEAPPRADAD